MALIKFRQQIILYFTKEVKLEKIEAPAQRDRIVQKILCQKVLIPQLRRKLIYDNYASLTDRGTSFARKRIDVLLSKYVQIYGNEGYVVQIDIEKYFESIDHKILKDKVHKVIKVDDVRILNLIDYIIDTSSPGGKGLNLGSEAPQILAVFFLTELDSGFKTVKGLKYYGRYMDDICCFVHTLEEAKEVLSFAYIQLARLKLRENKRKTNIVKLTHGFTFMQIKYSIDGRKIIKRPTRQKITRERRRLKKYKALFDRGLMSELEIHKCYLSWRNNVIKDCNRCDRTILELDKLYKSLFPNAEIYRKETRNEIIDITFRGDFYEIYRDCRQGLLYHYA